MRQSKKCSYCFEQKQQVERKEAEIKLLKAEVSRLRRRIAPERPEQILLAGLTEPTRAFVDRWIDFEPVIRNELAIRIARAWYGESLLRLEDTFNPTDFFASANVSIHYFEPIIKSLLEKLDTLMLELKACKGGR